MAKITSLAELTDVASDDLLVVVDKSDTSMADSGTDKKVQKVNLLKGLVPENGWIPAGETWTYAGADDPTYTFKVNADVTGKYSAGMKIKLTQTTVKYFIITAVSAYSGGYTTITVYGGTDYDLANDTITNPYYSMVKSPYGFPMSPDKWTVEKLDTNRRQQANPANSTWYNLGGINIVIPIGVWNVYWYALAGASGGTADCEVSNSTTLSTANNSESNKQYSAGNYIRYIKTGGGGIGFNVPLNKSFVLSATSRTTYYLNAMVYSSVAQTDLSFFGNENTTIIRATCAYL